MSLDQGLHTIPLTCSPGNCLQPLAHDSSESSLPLSSSRWSSQTTRSVLPHLKFPLDWDHTSELFYWVYLPFSPCPAHTEPHSQPDPGHSRVTSIQDKQGTAGARASPVTALWARSTSVTSQSLLHRLRQSPYRIALSMRSFSVPAARLHGRWLQCPL